MYRNSLRNEICLKILSWKKGFQRQAKCSPSHSLKNQGFLTNYLQRFVCSLLHFLRSLLLSVFGFRNLLNIAFLQFFVSPCIRFVVLLLIAFLRPSPLLGVFGIRALLFIAVLRPLLRSVFGIVCSSLHF